MGFLQKIPATEVTSLWPKVYFEINKAGKILTLLDRNQMLEYAELNNFSSYI